MTQTSADLTVTLHDGTALTARAVGSGPALLLPVRTEPHDPETAAAMRQWGAEPDLGPALVAGLADRFRVIAADYEGHRMAHPAAGTLTPAAVAADLLAVADAAGADRFGYYGYSWLALAGFQLALRAPDRLASLAMGGYPPADGPHAEMLAVTRAAHAKATAPRGAPAAGPVTPGDWDRVEIDADPAQTAQFATFYEALQDFDDTTAAKALTMPRLAFAGGEDEIAYGPGWGDTVVRVAAPLRRRGDELRAAGWDVELLLGLDHLTAMQSAHVLPLLGPWLGRCLPE